MKKRSRIIVCGKCQESMTVAFFVTRHRAKNGQPCRTVPCDTCGEPVTNNRYRWGNGTVFCDEACRLAHPSWEAITGGLSEVTDTLQAMERSEWLPDFYLGRRTS